MVQAGAVACCSKAGAVVFAHFPPLSWGPGFCGMLRHTQGGTQRRAGTALLLQLGKEEDTFLPATSWPFLSLTPQYSSPLQSLAESSGSKGELVGQGFAPGQGWGASSRRTVSLSNCE